ncbi:hypothetical protein [Methylobacterium komagatae]
MFQNEINFYLFQDFTKSNHISNCELRYVLRNLLSRGAEEANYRYMLSDGAKAEAYKRLKLMLLQAIDDLEAIITDDGTIVLRHRKALRQALVYARHLIAVEREETATQFEILEEKIKSYDSNVINNSLKTVF